MGKKRNSGTFEIALTGITCAVSSGALALGIISGYLTATGYLISIAALMVPLSKQFYRGGFFAYLVTCILAIVLGACVQFWDLVPFAVFFGLHPLVNALQLRFKINKWPAFAIKAVWFDGMLIVAYFVVFGGILGGSFMPEEFYRVINDYIYLFVFTLGTLFFFVYDHFIFKAQKVINYFVQRIIK